MTTRITVDDKLIDAAMKAEAAVVALQEYIKMKGRRRLLELEGTIDFDPGWNPRTARGKR